MDPRETLADLAREKGTSLAALSRMLGRNATYLQQYISKGSPRKLEEEDRRRLAQFFNVDESRLGAPEYKSYDPPEVSGIGSLGATLPMDSAQWVELDRMAIEASAGPGSVGAQETSFDTMMFSRRWLREQGLDPTKLSAIRVSGDSMDPLLKDGDEILVDRTPRPFREGIHVLRLGEVLNVKRLQVGKPGRVLLISANPAYEPIEVAQDEVDIIGRVVWKSGQV
ncbi:S24 family peptidase [Croceibacterium ferulae]|uniref:S24 family peptidase n=1 Tax=Croceibacterium ferulae TaxID=1854641 RepID=UPI000EAC3B2B|nr:S24 family peptidase [Croceibacterium ferulae]